MHVCILAAGQSKRMKSRTSKLLHPLCGKPMVLYVCKAVAGLQPESCSVVVGHQRDEIMEALGSVPAQFVVQEEQLGTAHAVVEWFRQYPDLKGSLLILNADTPLVSTSLLQELYANHVEEQAVLSLVTTEVENPEGYGRVVRSAGGQIAQIVEEADASADQKKIREVNAGIYLMEIDSLRELLPLITPGNRQQEYYLPDAIQLALQKQWKVCARKAPAIEVMGINTREQLAHAQSVLRKRMNRDWMLRGVTMHDPDTTYIDAEVQLGTDVTLYPNVYLEGNTMIGSESTVYPNCRITDSYLDSRCVVYENCSLDSAQLEEGVKVGPFARLRPGTYLRSGVRIGNFVELKKTTMGEDSKANHLTYLGDASIGKNVNIGAGTITCNYDGKLKHQTVIEDGVFIGSDSQLIAPVKVGKDAYVAAGSSITEDVPAESLAIARSRQVNKADWSKKKKPRKS